MDTLSTEILWEILGYIDSRGDLQSCRLVKRLFSELAKQFVFKTIFVQPSTYGLSGLIQISHRPDLAIYVKEIFLRWDKESINHTVWAEFNKKLQLKSISHEDKDKARALELFRSCVKNWYDFQTSPDYITILSAAFARCPQLRTLTVKDNFPCDRNLSLHWSKLSGYPLEPLDIFHGENGSADYSRAFHALVNAAFCAVSRITSFTVRSLWDGEAGLDESALEDPEFIRRVGVVFRNCRVIDLAFYTGIVVAGGGEFPLLQALSTAVHLETLNLYFTSEYSEAGVFSRFFGGTHIWPCLRIIDLCGMRLGLCDLLGFLKNHKDTLREVIIESCLLELGCWYDEVARFMRDSLRLVSVGLPINHGGCYGAYKDLDDGLHGGRAVEGCIVGGGLLPEPCHKQDI